MAHGVCEARTKNQQTRWSPEVSETPIIDILLMAEIRRSPVAGNVVYPAIFRVFIHPTWLALGFLPSNSCCISLTWAKNHGWRLKPLFFHMWGQPSHMQVEFSTCPSSPDICWVGELFWEGVGVGWFVILQEISNRTHWMDPGKTWVSNSSTNLLRGPLVRSHSIFDGNTHHDVW